MIYYSNTTLDTPHLTFIGRWSPFHQGHVTMIHNKIQEHPNNPILILVRNTTTDQYASATRAAYIQLWMQQNNIKGTIMIIPNVEGVYWGRGVGYNVGLVDVDEKIKSISGTRIRNEMQNNSELWKTKTALPSSADFLSLAIAHIIEHGFVVWLTGCPASGKTTIAKQLITTLRSSHPFLKMQLLDGDDVRASPLASFVGFTKKDRAEHIRRMAYLAKLFADQGILVICAFVSPTLQIRSEAKQTIGTDRFMEVYVQASKKTRLSRDPKGMYKKALKENVSNFTGLNASYEKPVHPSITCNTDLLSVDMCVRNITKKLLAL